MGYLCMKGWENTVHNNKRIIKTDVSVQLKHFGGDACDTADINIDCYGDKKDIIVYVAGVGDMINFELDLLKELGDKHVEIYAFDPTPKSEEFIKKDEITKEFSFLFICHCGCR